VKKTIIYILLTILSLNTSLAQELDSLNKALKSSVGEERIDILHLLVLKTWLNYPEKGMLYSYEALEIAKELGDSTNISKSIRLLAGVHYYKGDYNTSLNFNLEALEIAEKIKDSTLINNGYNNIGLLYYNLGSYPSALEYLLRAKEMKNALHETYGYATTLNNIGLVYQKVLNYQVARNYFFEALTMSSSSNDKDLIVYSQNNIGLSYLRENNIEIARRYFNKSLILANEIGNKNWGAVSLRGIGEVLKIQQNYDSAEYYYQKSLNASLSIDDKKGKAEAYHLFAHLNHLKGNNKKAIQYLNKSQEVAKTIQIRQQLLDNLKLFIRIYREQHNQEKIIQYQGAYSHLKDSLFQDIVSRNMDLVPIKIKEEQDQLTFLKQQTEIKSKDVANKILIWILLLATPLILVLVVLILKNTSDSKKLIRYTKKIEAQKEALEINNLELEKAKHLISEQKSELEILNVDLTKKVDKRTIELNLANKELRTTNLELDNLIYKSSHDIRGPLLRLVGVCNLALLEVKEQTALEYFRMIDKASKRLSNTVDKLKIITELNWKELENEPIDFIYLINQSLDQNKYIEGIEDIIIDAKVDNNLIFHSDPAVVELIIFNMIQNGIQLLKVSKMDSKKMKIVITKNEDSLFMTFEIENIELVVKENEAFYKLLSKDSEGNQNIGIGLYTVKQCVHKLGGELLLLGDIIHSTRFSINLPINLSYNNVV